MSNKKTITLVEDNAMNLFLFQDLLEYKNYKVIAISDGNLVMDSLRKNIPDLVIMDIRLNNMSGLDIVSQMKQDEQLAQIPVIAITAYASKNDEERILKAGCNAFIAKPIDIDDFYNIVATFVEKATV